MNDDLESIYERLEEIQESFDSLYEEALDLIPFENERIASALKTQLPLQLQWETLHKSSCRVHDISEMNMEEAYSDAITDELRDSYKHVSISEAKEFAKINIEYKQWKKALVKARSLRDEIKGVLDVITTRKYTLNNMSNVIIAGVEDHIL